MQVNAKPVRGTKDFLPKEMQIRDVVMKIITDTYKSFGFSHIQAPMMEDINIMHQFSPKMAISKRSRSLSFPKGLQTIIVWLCQQKSRSNLSATPAPFEVNEEINCSSSPRPPWPFGRPDAATSSAPRRADPRLRSAPSCPGRS